MPCESITGRDKILFINARQESYERQRAVLTEEKHRVVWARSYDDALETLNDESFALVIVAQDGESAVRPIVEKIRYSFPWLETIVVLDSENPDLERELADAGAYECLVSGRISEQLPVRIEKALERCRMRRELNQLRQHVAMSYGLDNIIGISRLITKLKENIARVAPTDITIMLSGSSGTGKELIARVLHHHSRRRKNRFVVIDCSAIPETRFESELFGAAADLSGPGGPKRRGLLLEADGGTLFLDEIDKLPIAVQPRLLSFLEDYVVRPVGQSKPIKADVRVIAASAKDLAELIGEGEFSEDLFCRLNILPLVIPDLSERAEDIETLTEYFLRKLAHELNWPSLTISRKAVDLLLSHNWPGNVRELENTLKRATALCQSNHLDADDIVFIESSQISARRSDSLRKTILKRKEGLLDESQRSVIVRALSDNNWNFTQTAQELGIGRTTLWRKVKKYNLRQEEVFK